MAVTSYEALGASNITNTRTLLHESHSFNRKQLLVVHMDTIRMKTILKIILMVNSKAYMITLFLSSSANHIFDITMGYDESSVLSSSTATQNAKKINMYNQFSQVLLGYTGSRNEVRKFEIDLTLDNVGLMKEAYFVNFSRLLTKDQIKKGTFSIETWHSSLDSFDEHNKDLNRRECF